MEYLQPRAPPTAGRQPSLIAPELWERMHPDDVKFAIRSATAEYVLITKCEDACGPLRCRIASPAAG